MATALDHTTPDAFNPATGRVDALRLANLLALETKAMAHITGKTSRYVRMSPDAPSLQPNLRRMLHIVDTLRRNLDGDLGQVRIWLNAPHPTLEGRSPLELIEAGHLDAVEELVHAIDTGMPY
jgi:uncharacterized protein (DUF2384 family)